MDLHSNATDIRRKAWPTPCRLLRTRKQWDIITKRTGPSCSLPALESKALSLSSCQLSCQSIIKAHIECLLQVHVERRRDCSTSFPIWRLSLNYKDTCLCLLIKRNDSMFSLPLKKGQNSAVHYSLAPFGNSI